MKSYCPIVFAGLLSLIGIQVAQAAKTVTRGGRTTFKFRSWAPANAHGGDKNLVKIDKDYYAGKRTRMRSVDRQEGAKLARRFAREIGATESTRAGSRRGGGLSVRSRTTREGRVEAGLISASTVRRDKGPLMVRFTKPSALSDALRQHIGLPRSQTQYGPWTGQQE
jgi:hypothetical protein